MNALGALIEGEIVATLSSKGSLIESRLHK